MEHFPISILLFPNLLLSLFTCSPPRCRSDSRKSKSHRRISSRWQGHSQSPHISCLPSFSNMFCIVSSISTVFLSLRFQRTLYTLGTHYTSPFLEIIIADFHQVLNWVLFRDYHDFILATTAMLQVRKWRLKEVGELAPGHTRISGGPAQAAHPGQTGSKSMLVTTMRRHCLILVYHFPHSGEETEVRYFQLGRGYLCVLYKFILPTTKGNPDAEQYIS